jgi:hypothetical protein
MEVFLSVAENREITQHLCMQQVNTAAILCCMMTADVIDTRFRQCLLW